MAMAEENKGLDLERELTCSICAEILYQPLTLLDCLHTFCGVCLKEWFSYQLNISRTATPSNPPKSTPYTCPSCRAEVRDVRHDAKVTTLLEMFLAVNPTKGRTDEERGVIGAKYKPGDNVLVKVEEREKTLRERRLEDEDRRMVEAVTADSLREVGIGGGEGSGRRLRVEGEGRRERSRDSRSGDDREQRRRRRESEGRTSRRRDESALSPETNEREERRRRRSNEEARRRHEETSRTAARQIEHQSSLRSLISSSDVDSHEMEEEILRQIREEGLLDGIDLENIDVTQEDQISERIAEAFKRRQSERARQERARSRDTRETRDRTRQSRTSGQNSRESSGDDTRAPRSRRAHSRTPSAVSNVSTVSALSQTAEPSRPPQSMSAAHAAHLEVQSGDEGRRRRRTSSGSRSRSSTAPIPAPESQTRPAARSATDLSNRPQSMDLSVARPAVNTSSRSTTEPSGLRAAELAAPERSRESQRATSSSPRTRQPARMEGLPPASGPMAIRNRAAPPSAVLPPSSASSAAIHAMADQSMVPLPLSPKELSRNSLNGNSLSERATAFSSAARPSSSSGPSLGARNRAPLYPEPSITCARCAKPHIEYELHYNCAICHDGNYNVCLSCYRKGDQDGNKVCLNWFGFGYSAWTRFERLIQSGDLPSDAENPHMLTANRYLPPRIIPGGAEGRKTLTTEDPLKRLESGTFCAGCLAWANECYWRCDFCNDGDWGFCNLCVNQGKCCTHPLLPLTFMPPETDIPPISPIRDHHIPSSASILTGPNVMDIGRFKPLTFSTGCDICRCIIPPTSTRYHCFQCVSKVPNTQPGDYDICTTCYPKLVVSRRISAENGNQGWRRCLQGHRMVIIGFQEKGGGQRRIIVQDLVGGRGLHQEPYTSGTHSDLQTWSWADGKNIKLVTNNVMSSPPSTVQILGLTQSHIFPPDGGVGMTCAARWSWWPAEGADDELMFPRGAEIRECKDVNGEWFHGSYMGKRGLFPSPYVRIKDKGVHG